ncbi:putative ABC transport system substrate-binding protein [Bradyrhizobium sp. USDA 4448]
MQRRDLLAGLLATTTVSALRAAEPTKVYRVVYCVHVKRPKPPSSFLARLLERLRQLGYSEGKNLIVDIYGAEDQPERYSEIARKAVEAKPDVIMVSWDNQLLAKVAKETSTIPIVAYMPSLDAGFVRNPNRPEGNITGIAADAGIEMQGKHLDILRQAVSSASRVAYLSNRYDWEGVWGRAVVEAGRASGVSIIGIPMDHWVDEDDYHQAFETVAQQSAEALMANGLGGNFTHRYLIAELALRYRLPSIGWYPDVVENGHGLLAYTQVDSDIPERWANSVAQVLKGTKIVDIPVSQPTNFVLSINLKTAKTLGLEIPAGLVARADQVIE